METKRGLDCGVVNKRRFNYVQIDTRERNKEKIKFRSNYPTTKEERKEETKLHQSCIILHAQTAGGQKRGCEQFLRPIPPVMNHDSVLRVFANGPEYIKKKKRV
jgi:hypothetical protein